MYFFLLTLRTFREPFLLPNIILCDDTGITVGRFFLCSFAYLSKNGCRPWQSGTRWLRVVRLSRNSSVGGETAMQIPAWWEGQRRIFWETTGIDKCGRNWERRSTKFQKITNKIASTVSSSAMVLQASMVWAYFRLGRRRVDSIGRDIDGLCISWCRCRYLFAFEFTPTRDRLRFICLSRRWNSLILGPFVVSRMNDNHTMCSLVPAKWMLRRKKNRIALGSITALSQLWLLLLLCFVDRIGLLSLHWYCCVLSIVVVGVVVIVSSHIVVFIVTGTRETVVVEGVVVVLTWWAFPPFFAEI